MIIAAIAFVVGVAAGAAGRNQVAEAVRFVGNKAYELIRDKGEDFRPPRKRRG